MDGIMCGRSFRRILANSGLEFSLREYLISLRIMQYLQNPAIPPLLPPSNASKTQRLLHFVYLQYNTHPINRYPTPLTTYLYNTVTTKPPLPTPPARSDTLLSHTVPCGCGSSPVPYLSSRSMHTLRYPASAYSYSYSAYVSSQGIFLHKP